MYENASSFSLCANELKRDNFPVYFSPTASERSQFFLNPSPNSPSLVEGRELASDFIHLYESLVKGGR